MKFYHYTILPNWTFELEETEVKREMHRDLPRHDGGVIEAYRCITEIRTPRYGTFRYNGVYFNDGAYSTSLEKAKEVFKSNTKANMNNCLNAIEANRKNLGRYNKILKDL